MQDIFSITYIVQGIVKAEGESPYIEFKENNGDPDEMGEYISALSNMALLNGVPFGYLIWGVSDKTHQFVGTTLSFKNWKKGGQEILAYWKNLLTPSFALEDYELEIEGHHVLVLRIPAATHFATTFKKQAYCRVGTNKKNIKEYPLLEKELWQKLEDTSPEKRVVLSELSKQQVEEELMMKSYYSSLNVPLPNREEEWLSSFTREGFILEREKEFYSITAYGALLFGKNLFSFAGLENKLIRIVRYNTIDRLETMGKYEFNEGYVSSFEKAFAQIMALIQKADTFIQGIRHNQYSLPPIAIREALGNALIHQDLLSTGGPLVEVFPNRVEFSNPGSLDVPLDRLIDSSPKPRNEKMASFLRRINIGDTAGSGFDKIVASLEKEHLPPMKVEQTPSGVRVILFFAKSFDQLLTSEKQKAIYDHVVLAYLSSTLATNSSIRERFGLGERAKYQISRLLFQAVSEGIIKKTNGSDKKDSAYIPYWA